MGARSRSRSRSPRVDQFGRIVIRDNSRSPSRHRSPRRRRTPPRRYSRSRSRDRHRRSRSRSHSRSYRSHSRTSSRRRSRSSSRHRHYRPRRSRSRSRSRSPRITSYTNANSEDLLKSRVFIGNLPIDKITKPELETMFSKYGKILGLSIHEKGFGFVQFESEDDAQEAVKNENGGLLKSKKLDVKMALEGRKKMPPRPSPGVPRTSPPPAAGGAYDRWVIYVYQPAPAERGERERSPVRAADPYEDRYRDPYGAPPPRREDPYYADPYRRPPPPEDPYYDRYRDDPYGRYRRDPYADPYRDPYYRDYPPYEAPPRKAPPPDCEIVILNNTLRNYGEFVERKLKALTLVVTLSVITEDKTIPQVIEESSKKGCLFAIVINSQNETHQSLTVNILHGTPQEHRNMPVEDAMTLISRSFETYVQKEREKAAPPPERAPPAPAPAAARTLPPFLPPTSDIAYLLNLLADNRQLTTEELDKVIIYLRERRDKLYESEGRRPPAEAAGYSAVEHNKNDPAHLQQEQQELQAKILSILNNPEKAGEPKAAGPPGRPGMPMGNGAQPQAGGQGGMSSLINFDNPSVQKALDNLIQSGPNLLKNINPQQAAGVLQQAQGEVKREAQHAGYGHPQHPQHAQHPGHPQHPQHAQHPGHPQHPQHAQHPHAQHPQHAAHLAQAQHPVAQAQRPMYAHPQGAQPRAQIQPAARRPY
ncbi:hypothetical protein FSP39_021183 [Pinctada imbricata]|uniref:RRM domain-containing protein n=1 Tax=Pinctada imbricata TaxID=66713 RepID=A0AA89BXT1_PINIB|nr:hypothetical protein FSP39_021183 [Pinctada imbricata]